MYVIVVGCGRTGSEVAARLCRADHSVVVIDRDKQAFKRLPDDFTGATIVGHAIDDDVLRSAGVADADAVVAATYGDNTNLTTAQIARRAYKVPRSIARVKDPMRAVVFAELGVETICSTDIMAGRFMQTLESSGPSAP